MPKEYHVVFGEHASRLLTESNYVELSDENLRLITCNDNLSEGRLFDLKTLDGIAEREESLKDFYKEDYEDEFGVKSFYFVNTENLEELEQIDIDISQEKFNRSRKGIAIKLSNQLNEISSGDSVFIWLGNQSNEYIWKAAVLNFLEKINVTIYIINWSQLIISNEYGKIVKPCGLFACYPNLLPNISNFERLSKNEISEWSMIWKQLYINNSELRLLKNGNIIEGDIHYFDSMLLAQCTQEYQKNARIVGDVLIKLSDQYENIYVFDRFMFRRLEDLVSMGLLENKNIVNRSQLFDVFDVKLKKHIN